jgi:hypothetical protein
MPNNGKIDVTPKFEKLFISPTFIGKLPSLDFFLHLDFKTESPEHITNSGLTS